MGQSISNLNADDSEILQTEEQEKEFNNEFEFLRAERDAHLGDFAIMREINNGRLVGVKEKLFTNRYEMIQFYNSLKAVEVLETFYLFDGNINMFKNGIGLKLIDQKDNVNSM